MGHLTGLWQRRSSTARPFQHRDQVLHGGAVSATMMAVRAPLIVERIERRGDVFRAVSVPLTRTRIVRRHRDDGAAQGSGSVSGGTADSSGVVDWRATSRSANLLNVDDSMKNISSRKMTSISGVSEMRRRPGVGSLMCMGLEPAGDDRHLVHGRASGLR
jgi:hypothetical protein